MKPSIALVHVSLITTNCSIVLDEDSGEALVVDPGEFSSELRSTLEGMGIESLRYILLTHGHFDHIDGALRLQRAFGGLIAISKEDETGFFDQSFSMGRKFGFEARYPEKADLIIADGDELPFGDSAVKVIATPGHTEGSVCFELGDVLFSGDTLLAGSCGRTDFKTGNDAKMFASLKKLAALRGNRRVIPGHGSLTDLETERRTNPYLKNGQ